MLVSGKAVGWVPSQGTHGLCKHTAHTASLSPGVGIAHSSQASGDEAVRKGNSSCTGASGQMCYCVLGLFTGTHR